jgi:hypothetical protein
VKTRDGSDLQRWTTDGQSAEPKSLSIAGAGRPLTTRAPQSPRSADLNL